jgi:hypothetical protein
VRDNSDPTVYPEKIFNPFNPNERSCSFGGSNIFGILQQQEQLKEIGYYPSDDFYKELIDQVAKIFKFSPVGWETQEELELWIKNESISTSVIAIEFDNATHVSHTINN